MFWRFRNLQGRQERKFSNDNEQDAAQGDEKDCETGPKEDHENMLDTNATKAGNLDVFAEFADGCFNNLTDGHCVIFDERLL